MIIGMKRQNKEQGRQNIMTGRAGEYAVAAQLLLRGVNPCFSAVDQGVDLIGPKGCRIQVKSVHLTCTPKTLKKNLDGVYRFGFDRNRYRYNSSRGPIKDHITRRPPMSEYCDIVILWGIEQNRFWIVPSSLLDSVDGVALGPDNSRGFSKDVDAMKEMLKKGFTQEDVANHFNISQASVSIRLKRSGTKIYLSSTTAQIRQCENAWHYILDFGLDSELSNNLVNRGELRLVESTA
jgi:hypothetical protein